jgi:hypothetical protein
MCGDLDPAEGTFPRGFTRPGTFLALVDLVPRPTCPVRPVATDPTSTMGGGGAVVAAGSLIGKYYLYTMHRIVRPWSRGVAGGGRSRAVRVLKSLLYPLVLCVCV